MMQSALVRTSSIFSALRRPLITGPPALLLPTGTTALRRSDATTTHSPEVPHSAKIGRLNHVAIAVPDLNAASELYRYALGAKVSPPKALPEHGVTVVFVELDNAKLELLQPLGESSPVAKFLEKNPAGGLHHICVEVPDVKAGIGHVKASGVRTLTDEPKTGAHGVPVVFLHPKDCNGVLMELEEATCS